MCGIVGYVGPRDATPIILSGLKRLEYRGYDSAGLAVVHDGRLEIRKDAGKLSQLVELVERSPISGAPGVGHTRWATHGAPSARNAHPHVGQTERVVVVHNGIVENFLELKDELTAEGVTFHSDTDTETIVHLVEHFQAAGLGFVEAARRAFQEIRGANVIVLLSADEPDLIVAARLGNAGGVVIGLGDGENFLASDTPAIMEHTRRVIFLESRQMTVVTSDKVRVETLEGAEILPEVHAVAWDPITAEKGEYRHFMQKEIHEQVRSITDTLAGRVDFARGEIRLPDLKLTAEARQANREDRDHRLRHGRLCRHGRQIPDREDRPHTGGGEHRFRVPLQRSDHRQPDGGAGHQPVGRDGRHAGGHGGRPPQRRRAVEHCQCHRFAGDAPGRRIHLHADRARDRRGLDQGLHRSAGGPVHAGGSAGAFARHVGGEHAPGIGGRPEADARPGGPDTGAGGRGRRAGVRVQGHSRLPLPGTGNKHADRLRGRLKLKEISYIHAEGYPAGEMKHGPIALIDQNMPVVCLAPRDPWHEKMISQIQQAKARGGIVVAVATDGDELVSTLVDHVLRVPPTPWMLSPVVTVLPLQLLAYHIATLRGLDVDQPRNLAKSVTVE